MSSPWIEAVRSVALNVPDLAQAETFYTEVWRLAVSHRSDHAIYLRGTGSFHHILSLHCGAQPDVRNLTFSVAAADDLAAIANRSASGDIASGAPSASSAAKPCRSSPNGRAR